jgi:hypothetical protein
MPGAGFRGINTGDVVDRLKVGHPGEEDVALHHSAIGYLLQIFGTEEGQDFGGEVEFENVVADGTGDRLR